MEFDLLKLLLADAPDGVVYALCRDIGAILEGRERSLPQTASVLRLGAHT